MLKQLTDIYAIRRLQTWTRNTRSVCYACLLAGLMLLIAPEYARAADCTVPNRPEGTVLYNTTYKVVQYCNGTEWKSVGTASSPCEPAPVSFADTTGINPETYATSGEVTLTGLGGGCSISADFQYDGSIIVNGVDTGENSGVAVVEGDKVQLRAKAPPGNDVSIVSSLLAGGKTVGEWSLTTTACPAGSGTQSYTTPGTHDFATPPGTENCGYTITVKGGGGGGGVPGGGDGGGINFGFVPAAPGDFHILVGGGGGGGATCNGGYGGGGG